MALICQSCSMENSNDREYCKYCGSTMFLDKNCLKPGTLLDRRYKIINLIKSGGMGAVYKSKDLRLDDICAVKEMLDFSPSDGKKKRTIKRFHDEAKIITRLRHVNLPRIRDYFIENERYYLVMDFIEGQDLETIWNNTQGRSIEEKEVVEWSLQILKLLNYLHTQNPPIIYRDIKPSNMILRKNTNELVLIDFGIAKLISEVGETPKLKTSSGTEGYSPPEQYMGVYSPQTDIYSLGVTMHQLLTGIPPLIPFKFDPICEKNATVSKKNREYCNEGFKRKS